MYDIITETLHKLPYAVGEATSDGWTPVGGPFPTGLIVEDEDSRGNSQEYPEWGQAIYKSKLNKVIPLSAHE